MTANDSAAQRTESEAFRSAGATGLGGSFICKRKPPIDPVLKQQIMSSESLKAHTDI